MKGIYLVANLKSQDLCANLIYSIRSSGCKLPIRLIPFGGPPVRSNEILKEVKIVNVSDFGDEANSFISELSDLLTECPRGYLYRFLGWFGDWDEFIYSDNDIVALTNWNRFFDYLPGNDLVHADEEYKTQGHFNYDQPVKVEQCFGPGSLLSAMTAGHFAARRGAKHIDDLRKAIAWFRENPEVPKKHDQALLHIASLIGGWKMLNLCRPADDWLSSWVGDYKNPLELVQAMQAGSVRKI